MFTVLDTWRDRWLWHFVRNRYSYAIEITSTHRYPSNINVLRHRWVSSAAQLLWFFFRSLALGIFIITRWKCRRYTYNNYLDCNYFFSSPIHPSITFLRFFFVFFLFRSCCCSHVFHGPATKNSFLCFVYLNIIMFTYGRRTTKFTQWTYDDNLCHKS